MTGWGYDHSLFLAVIALQVQELVMDVVQSATFVTVAKLIITLFILQSLCIQGKI